MKSHTGERAEIRPGSTGQFDVLVDGKLIFSKGETGRFPEEGEVERRVSALRRGKAGHSSHPVRPKTSS